jgi:hypothetical protein
MDELDDLDRRFFVGRSAEHAGALDALLGAAEGLVWDVVGVHGIGKTELLKQVRVSAERLARAGRAVVVYEAEMAGQGLDEGFRGDHGSNALLATFAASRRLMLACAEKLSRRLKVDHIFADFMDICANEGKGADKFEREHMTAAGSTSHSWSDGDRKRIRDFQATVDDAFVEAWTEFSQKRQVLVTLDTFEEVAENELGHWLVRTALRLPKTLTVVARVPSSTQLALGHPRVTPQHLPYFTVDQVEESLCKRVRVDTFQKDVAKVVHLHTDGHPGGVALIAELIKIHGVDIDARTLRRLLDHLPADSAKQWGSVVDLIVEGVPDPLLPSAVQAASVALSFDEPLLADLLRASGKEGDIAGGALGVLGAYGLTQLIEGRSADREDPPRFRLHEFIRLSLEHKLRTERFSEWVLLHQAAADHYSALLDNDEQNGAGSYGGWYRYERAKWQADKRQWLYHAGRLPGRRELTRAQFVLVFLEAFWWYSCYEPLGFERKLLDDWERATVGWAFGRTDPVLRADQELAEALEKFLDGYPTGYVKPPTARWDEMESNLLLVRDLCGLSPDAGLPKDDKDRSTMMRAQSMINVFLAHSYRFRDPADPSADYYYGQALQTFDHELKDEWMAAWLLFETGDLALERAQQAQRSQQPDQEAVQLRCADALSLVAKAAGRTLADMTEEEPDEEAADESDLAEEPDEEAAAAGDWDYELLANLHRVRADVHWLQDELTPAATEYGLAVAGAYWFHGIPHPPDSYTQRFYAEMTERAAERIVALAKSDREKAVAFASQLRDQVPGSPVDAAAVLVESALPGLVAALFPSGPESPELERSRSPFLARWRRHRETWRRTGGSGPADQFRAMAAAEPTEPLTTPS